jgi:hypothetical protein
MEEEGEQARKAVEEVRTELLEQRTIWDRVYDDESSSIRDLLGVHRDDTAVSGGDIRLLLKLLQVQNEQIRALETRMRSLEDRRVDLLPNS